MHELRNLNDERLGALIEAADDAARAAAIEAILAEMRPVVRRVIRHATSRLLPVHDLEDIESAVNLRLFRRLELARLYEGDAIRSLDEFVATLTYNGVYDFFRSRYPERTRLKARLRYLFTHERRLAMWQSEHGLLCGLAAWRGRDTAGPHEVITRLNASSEMRDRSAPARAMLALFDAVTMPLTLEQVVDLMAELWGISEVELARETYAVSEEPAPDNVESRQYLAALWAEIRELRPPQRAALLLNLRDDDGVNALVHLVAARIASPEDIAVAVGLSREQLAAVWDDLPIGDTAIGAMLGLTRQQVINLRKAARERLARRMRRQS